MRIATLLKQDLEPHLDGGPETYCIVRLEMGDMFVTTSRQKAKIRVPAAVHLDGLVGVGSCLSLYAKLRDIERELVDVHLNNDGVITLEPWCEA